MTITEKRCNLCGSAFDEWDYVEGFGFHEHLGYGSKYDLHILDMDFCCRCFDKIIDYVKDRGAIDPIVGEYDI